MIYIEKVRERIHLRSLRPTPRLSATVPGASFNKGTARTGGPYWSMACTLTACRALRERFGAELEVGEDLWAWAQEEAARTQRMGQLGRAKDAKVKRLKKKAPKLAKAMEARTYQRVAARFIAEGRTVLIADQPGLGKTLEALGGIVEAKVPGPYLVVAPKTAVQAVWAQEIPRWLGKKHTVITVPDGKAKRDQILSAFSETPGVYDGQPMEDTMRLMDEHYASLKRTWVVVHPEMVLTRVWWVCGECGEETPRKAGKVALKCQHDASKRKANRVDHTFPQLFEQQWGAIICDESDRAIIRLTGTPTQRRQGMELLEVREEDGLKIAMSGTPTRGKPHLLWSTLNWLDEKAHPGFWNWAAAHWQVTDGKFGGKEIGELTEEGEANLWRSLEQYVLRRTKEEVAPDMPAKTYVGTPAYGTEGPMGVWLEMSGPQARQYREMLASGVAQLEDGARLEAIGHLAEMTRLKQFAGTSGSITLGPKGEKIFKPALPSNKFDYTVQLLGELGYPDDPQTKVVIASQFTEVLDLFARELPGALQKLSDHPRSPLPSRIVPLSLTGAVTGKRRQYAIDELNQPVGQGHHIMLLNTKAGGVAITLDYADVMVVLDETFTPDDQEQLEDRIHRVSRPRPVHYYYLRSLDSVDLGIALVNQSREYDVKRLLDGRRGTAEYARAVMDQTRKLAG